MKFPIVRTAFVLTTVPLLSLFGCKSDTAKPPQSSSAAPASEKEKHTKGHKKKEKKEAKEKGGGEKPAGKKAPKTPSATPKPGQ